MPNQLPQFQSMEELQRLVADIVTHRDRQAALQLSQELRLQLRSGGSLTQDGRGSVELAELLAQLSYIRFLGLSDTQALALIKDYLPLAFSLPDFDFDIAITERLDDYELLPDRVAFEKELLSVFQKHTAVLGDATITIGSRQVAGTIGNWLTDYENFPSKAQRDELDALNYLNKSANVRKLSEPERRILLAIIKVYDVLKADIYAWNSAPEPQTEAEIFKDYDLYDYLPDVEREGDDAAALTAPTTPVSAPRPNKIVAPVADHGFAPAPLATPKPEQVATSPVPYQEDPIRPHRVINRPDLPNTTSDAAATQKEVLANIQAAKAQGLVSAKLPPVAPLPHPEPHPDMVPNKLDDLRKRIQP